MPLIELFTSPTCMYCPSAKSLIEEVSKEQEDIAVIEHTPMTEEGRKRAVEFNISSVPTIHISDGVCDKIEGIIGVPSKSELIRILEKVRNHKSETHAG